MQQNADSVLAHAGLIAWDIASRKPSSVTAVPPRRRLSIGNCPAETCCREKAKDQCPGRAPVVMTYRICLKANAGLPDGPGPGAGRQTGVECGCGWAHQAVVAVAPRRPASLRSANTAGAAAASAAR